MYYIQYNAGQSVDCEISTLLRLAMKTQEIDVPCKRATKVWINGVVTVALSSRLDVTISTKLSVLL